MIQQQTDTKLSPHSNPYFSISFSFLCRRLCAFSRSHRPLAPVVFVVSLSCSLLTLFVFFVSLSILCLKQQLQHTRSETNTYETTHVETRVFIVYDACRQLQTIWRRFICIIFHRDFVGAIKVVPNFVGLVDNVTELFVHILPAGCLYHTRSHTSPFPPITFCVRCFQFSRASSF